MTPDQIDPFSKQIVDCTVNNWTTCHDSRISMVAESLAWHLKRLPENRDRKRVLLNLSKHICLECGNDQLPCFCIADD